MYCQNCGQQQPDNVKFCNNCGAPLQTSQQPVQNQPTVTATPVTPPPVGQVPVQTVQPAAPRKKAWYKRWWVWVILIFLSLAVFSGIMKNVAPKNKSITDSSSSSSKPSSSVKIKPTDSPPTEDPEEVKSKFIDSCSEIDYTSLARNPDKYKGDHFKFTGEVIQVLESDSWFSDGTTLRINVTEEKLEYIDESLWSDTIICTVNIPDGSDRILEDDIIDIYGICDGLYTYDSILGQKITLPKIDIKYYSIHE